MYHFLDTATQRNTHCPSLIEESDLSSNMYFFPWVGKMFVVDQLYSSTFPTPQVVSVGVVDLSERPGRIKATLHPDEASVQILRAI